MAIRTGNAPLNVEFLTPAGLSQTDATAIRHRALPALIIASGDGVGFLRLPKATKGKTCIVINTATTMIGVLQIYPNVGAAINLLGANNFISLPMQTSTMFIAQDSSTWLTCPTVPS